MQERMEETKAHSEHVFDQSDTYLAEFKQNMKSSAHIRRGSSQRDLGGKGAPFLSSGDQSSNGGDSLNEELGSLQSELGGFL